MGQISVKMFALSGSVLDARQQPGEQLASGYTMLARHQRHAHAGLVGQADQGRFLLGGPSSAALIGHGDHFDFLVVSSHIHSRIPRRNDNALTVSGHPGGYLTYHQRKIHFEHRPVPHGPGEIRPLGVAAALAGAGVEADAILAAAEVDADADAGRTAAVGTVQVGHVLRRAQIDGAVGPQADRAAGQDVAAGHIERAGASRAGGFDADVAADDDLAADCRRAALEGPGQTTITLDYCS
jgi:hypothetical protein